MEFVGSKYGPSFSVVERSEHNLERESVESILGLRNKLWIWSAHCEMAHKVLTRYDAISF